jgi:release factor glutamine methyltransferase
MLREITFFMMMWKSLDSLCALFTIGVILIYHQLMTTIRNLLSDPTRQEKKVLEKLLCHVTGLTKEQLFTSYDIELTQEQTAKIHEGYHAYSVEKKPLDYILGSVEFYRRPFTVDGRCLVPRPETEYMIEGVCEHIASRKEQNTARDHLQSSSSAVLPHRTLIDVGTGCGVLGLSVLLEHPTFFDHAYLTEYFEDTLSLARENYATYKENIGGNTDITLLQWDLVDFLSTTPAVSPSDEIILIANLPYIPDETFDTQAEDNVKKREPRPAFVWWTDGLDYYRQMFAQLFAYAPTDITLFLEMMTRQVDILRREFDDTMIFDEIKTFHFNIRIVKARIR